ncbi:MAG: alkaline phosphatase family protein [Gallionella sp.]
MPISLRPLLVFCLLSLSSVAQAAPRPDHVIIVIEENHGYTQIMDKKNQHSYLHALAKRGLLFTQSHGVTHPSQGNYLALFSGSTQGVTHDNCPLTFDGDNLAATLQDNGLSFATYSESMPTIGDSVCMAGPYRRKHNPMVNWPQLAASANLRLRDFPKDFSKLPTLSFVIPNQNNDMHDGSFKDADTWLKTHLNPYVEWAYKHNSLLVLTWDEDNFTDENHIVTLLVGPMVKAGISDQRINHYNILHTLLNFYGLPAPGAGRKAALIEGVWR